MPRISDQELTELAHVNATNGWLKEAKVRRLIESLRECYKALEPFEKAELEMIKDRSDDPYMAPVSEHYGISRQSYKAAAAALRPEDSPDA